MLHSNTKCTQETVWDRIFNPSALCRVGISPEDRLPSGGHKKAAVDQGDVCPATHISTQLYLHNNNPKGACRPCRDQVPVQQLDSLAVTPRRLTKRRK